MSTYAPVERQSRATSSAEPSTLAEPPGTVSSPLTSPQQQNQFTNQTRFAQDFTRVPAHASPPIPSQLQGEPALHRLNSTGLPTALQTGIETLSGLSMDDVHVHYQSAMPADLDALAYTQGTEIHVGPGQEQYLPHEAWHVVQQMQRRVRPTLQLQGQTVNDDQGLEKEADAMGAKAVDTSAFHSSFQNSPVSASVPVPSPIQGVFIRKNGAIPSDTFLRDIEVASNMDSDVRHEYRGIEKDRDELVVLENWLKEHGFTDPKVRRLLKKVEEEGVEVEEEGVEVEEGGKEVEEEIPSKKRKAEFPGEIPLIF